MARPLRGYRRAGTQNVHLGERFPTACGTCPAHVNTPVHPSVGTQLDESDPDKLIEHVVALEPTFGGINLEDIKAPECFYVEVPI